MLYEECCSNKTILKLKGSSFKFRKIAGCFYPQSIALNSSREDLASSSLAMSVNIYSNISV